MWPLSYLIRAKQKPWPDQKKDNDKYKNKDNYKDNDKDNDKDKDNDNDKDITFTELLQRAILVTCDIDYISDNREPEFMTIFVTQQLRVTLDSIRNSCDVLCNPISGPCALLWT